MTTTLRLVTYRNTHFVLIGTLGGFLFGVTQIPMGWMLGSLLFVALFSAYSVRNDSEMALPSIWKNAAQIILAIQVGNHMNASLLKSHFTGQILVLFLAAMTLILLSSCLIGYIFSKLTKVSFMTGLLAICPGGVSVVPLLTKEWGVNPLVVSTTQVLRVIIVACTIPAISSRVSQSPTQGSESLIQKMEPLIETSLYEWLEFFRAHPHFWTLSLFLAACLGVGLFRLFHFPSALLMGSLLGVTIIQYMASGYLGLPINAWLPHGFDISMQILIGVNIGATFKPDMLVGWKKNFVTSLVAILCLMFISLLAAWGIHLLIQLPIQTAILSLAPGGLAAMVATAISLDSDASLVASAQTIRLFMILMSLSLITLWQKIKESRLTT